jgi:hypothetical protein
MLDVAGYRIGALGAAMRGGGPPAVSAGTAGAADSSVAECAYLIGRSRRRARGLLAVGSSVPGL